MELERHEQIWFDSYVPELFDDEGYHLIFGRTDAEVGEGVSLGDVGFVSFFSTLLIALVMML